MLEFLFGPSLMGLVASALFALSILCVRKGLDFTDAARGTLISIAVSTAVFWVTAPFYMQWSFWLSPAMLIFGGVGLFRPVFSTWLANAATKQVGPTVAATAGSVGPLFSVAGGVLLLAEPLTSAGMAGTLAIVGGVMVLSWRPGGARAWMAVALLLPLASALLRSTAHVLIKLGLEQLREPFMAGMASYTVSLLLMLLLTLPRRRRPASPLHRGGLKWFGLAGLANAAAIMALNVALAKGLLVYVGPLTATFPLFTLAFSVLFFRQEVFTRTTLAGVALISAGVIAITALG